MDCERFDHVVLDLLYDELDELTHAAANRHVEHCTRCGEILNGFKATRTIGTLPLVEPPDDLESRILRAERQARAELPWSARAGKAISVLAGYAMRPQLAMAALLLLMVGASLLLLRARPGDSDNMRVTERGVPEVESDTVAIVPIPEKTPNTDHALEAHGAQLGSNPAASNRDEKEAKSASGKAAPTQSAPSDNEKLDTDDKPYDEAMAAYRAGRYAEATKSFEAVAEKDGKNAPSAALFAAQATRHEAGCSVAAARFEKVGTRYSGTGVGNEATWQAADCYRSLGQLADARRNYNLLLSTPGYGDRAKAALAQLTPKTQGSMVASRKAKAAPTPPKATKKAQPKATTGSKAAPPSTSAPNSL